MADNARQVDPSSGRSSGSGHGSPSLAHSDTLAAPSPNDGGIQTFLKPANDEMLYRHLVLPNGVRVMLVSDPTTDKAGAAMDVCAGSLADPDDLPGLAHFTEHMLFYSSKKYPVEDEYTKFISDRGGTTNAYTSAEHTNYHFDINWESLEPALDRFAQFFIAPTISADGIEREVRAVDSEHGKNLSQDAWRKAQVNKATANKSHPWARFSTGNRDTLYVNPLAAGTDPRAAVVDFYDHHYSSNRCALAVLGRQPLDELEAMVRSKFSDVPNKGLPRSTYPEEVFLPDQMGVLLRIVPVREGQSLELVWQVPSAERLYREQPLGYLSHLLGHEGEGSVFAALKAAGWASALVAGESGGGLSFVSFFMVHVELTEEGQRNIRDVAMMVFRYLAMLRQPGGICSSIWEEVRGLAQLHFDTRDKAKPITYCTTLAGAMHAYPPTEMLPALYGIPRVFSPEAIREALELLTPQRVRAFWMSKAHLNNDKPPTAATPDGTTSAAPEGDQGAATDSDSGGANATAATAGAAPATEVDVPHVAAPAAATKVAAAPETAPSAEAAAGSKSTIPQEDGKQGGGGRSGLRTEPVYGTLYDIGPLPADWLEAWISARPEGKPSLHLPAPNRFIPTDLSLVTEEAAATGAQPQPHVAVAVPGRLRLWHCPDVRFGQPKAVLYLDVQSPEAYASPRAAVMTRLFVKLLLDYLNEVAYPAQQAGLDYNVVNTQSGWQLLLSGYNHKMHKLLREVLDRVARFKVLPDRFEFVREGVVREYANQLHNQPYSWAMYRAEMLTTARRWPIELYGGLAASVTADELHDFVRRLTSRCFVEGLAVGNLRRREVLRCGAMLLSCLRDHCGAAGLQPCERAELRVLRVPPAPPTSASSSPLPTSSSAAPSSSPSATASAPAAAPSPSPSPLPSSSPPPPPSCPSPRGVGGGWLLAEGVPNGTDDNSAALVQFQVGPDCLRRNALRSLLVQLAKRDAFAELRTQQQLGYIVSLHGGVEHGVGYVELLVQSNAHSAADLCSRMDEFMARFLCDDLPVKCGLAPATAGTASQAAAAPEEAGQSEGFRTEAEKGTPATAGDDVTAATARDGPTEFEIAVEELAKSKLEKPKKLGDLVSRWWPEVQHGTYCFDRREAEVAELRSLSPAEMLLFAREVLVGLGQEAPRRKISVQVRGRAEEARAATQPTNPTTIAGEDAGPQDGTSCTAQQPPAADDTANTTITTPTTSPAAAAAASGAYAAIPAADPFTWKRSCEAWPTVRAMWEARRAAAGEPPLPYSVAEEEVEQLVTELRREEKAGAAAAGSAAEAV